MNGPFRRLHHLSILVHDIEHAVEYYEQLGIGPWLEYPPMTGLSELEVSAPEAFAKMQYRYAQLENIQIQLLEPPMDDCPQRRYLDQHGQGVWMLGFDIPSDEQWEQTAAGGIAPMQRGRRVDGSGWTYLDTMDDAGAVMMLLHLPPQTA